MAGGGEALAAMASGLGDAASSVGEGIGLLGPSTSFSAGLLPSGAMTDAAIGAPIGALAGSGISMTPSGLLDGGGGSTLDTMKQIMGGAKDLAGQLNQGGANRAQVQAPQAGPVGGIPVHIWGAAFDPNSRLGTIAPFNRVSVNPGPPPLSGLFR